MPEQHECCCSSCWSHCALRRGVPCHSHPHAHCARGTRVGGPRASLRSSARGSCMATPWRGCRCARYRHAAMSGEAHQTAPAASRVVTAVSAAHLMRACSPARTRSSRGTTLRWPIPAAGPRQPAGRQRGAALLSTRRTGRRTPPLPCRRSGSSGSSARQEQQQQRRASAPRPRAVARAPVRCVQDAGRAAAAEHSRAGCGRCAVRAAAAGALHIDTPCLP